SFVLWYSWGLTRTAYIASDETLQEGWFLKEKLEHYDALVPLLVMECRLPGGNDHTINVVFKTTSRIFSFYSSQYDDAADRWLMKPDRRAAMRNAQTLGAAIEEVVSRVGNGTVVWQIDRGDHFPDLLGDVPSVLESELGASGKTLSISTIGG